MKKSSFLWLFVSLFLLTVPMVPTSAYDDGVVIELLEVSGFLSGDDPLGNPDQEGFDPPRPLDFHATITGSTLAITSGTHSAQVIVRNSAGTQVLNRQFVGSTVEQLSTGSYSL